MIGSYKLQLIILEYFYTLVVNLFEIIYSKPCPKNFYKTYKYNKKLLEIMDIKIWMIAEDLLYKNYLKGEKT
jgi:hypothetical protein